MVQVQFADLTSGYERFDALAKNLEGIFEKVYAMREYKLDISYYEKKFEEFKKDFKLKDDFLQNTNMPFESMQKDYEGFVLTECNKKLEELTIEFEENVTPIYNIYLLFTMLDGKIKNSNDDDIDDVISKTIKLIDQINGVYTHNKIEVTRLVERAYETIYNALLYEEVYGRHDILEYLKGKNLSTNRENLGRVIRADVKKQIQIGNISKGEIDEEFIEHLDEGLGYDYLSPEFLNLVSRKSLISKYEEVGFRKQQMKDYMDRVVGDYHDKKTTLEDKSKETSKNIRSYRLTKAKLSGKALSLVLVPIILISAGHAIGKTESNKITEYATITRVVDLDTGDVIGEPEMVYDENVTSYVATITIYSPWRKNPTGVGYIRNATSYEYNVPEDVSEDYHVSREDIEGNLREKYRFNEPKEVLDENDSLTDMVIQVTETYQDKSISRKSTKYIIPFTIVGGVLGIAIDVALYLTHLISLDEIRRRFSRLNERIKSEKLSNEEIKKELANMAKEAESIEADKKRIEEKYSIEIDTSLLENKEKALELRR